MEMRLGAKVATPNKPASYMEKSQEQFEGQVKRKSEGEKQNSYKGNI